MPRAAVAVLTRFWMPPVTPSKTSDDAMNAKPSAEDAAPAPFFFYNETTAVPATIMATWAYWRRL